MSNSALDDATLARMRAEAQADKSPFIDPALYREARSLMHLAYDGWLARVIGRPVTSWHALDNAELDVAVKAVYADMDHLEAVAEARLAGWQHGMREAQAKVKAERQAARDQWQALAARLPVPVAVWHNWTARHLDGYEQGADHIVVMADLNAGRFHRTAQRPLCWTPSRARQLRHVDANVGDERRLPDCKACLEHARRIASQGEQHG